MSQDTSPFGPELQKYWNRRYLYFKRFDEGIKTDAEGLYSVMPEDVSLEHAKLIRSEVVVDGFAGIGGSAIGFAREGKRVIAIDINSDRLEMARVNAGIYGVADSISFVNDDFFEAAKKYARGAAVNLDPPWGGPDYKAIEKFGLENFEPSGSRLLDYCSKLFEEIMFRVPANFDMSQIEDYGMPFNVHDDLLDGGLISKTAVIYPSRGR
ncbi:hypothetical protein [Actinoallomurus acaciae]|uniref:Trimethylguanosine synthase n=1 Tax=Actinoallomurus acaciae TaxID=502577 RepID=A0ABV5YKK5_9ACTN